METTDVPATHSVSSLIGRFWPEVALLLGSVLVVVATVLGRCIDGRNVTVGPTDAVVVVIVVAVTAVWCFAAFLVGRLSKVMRGRPGEGLVMLMVVTTTALCGLPVSMIVGWAIRLSVAADPF